MTDVDIFSAMSGVGSLAAAWATLATVMEMKQQRLAGERPNIVIIDQTVYGIANSDEKLPPIFEWHETDSAIKNNMNNLNDAPMRKNYSLRMVNIGRGAASDIEALWQIEINKLVGEIKYICSLCESNFQIDVTTQTLVIQSLKPHPPYYVALSLEHDLRQRVKILLPANERDQDVGIWVPSTFRILISLYYYLRITFSDQAALPRSIDPIDLCKINLKLSYKDLGRRSFVDRYRVQLEWTMLQQGYGGMEKPHRFGGELVCRRY